MTAPLSPGHWCDDKTLARTEEAAKIPVDRLVRHAVCFGMTGSGKTGLCVALLEELASQGVPLLIIDPKGDLGNLALAFKEHRAEDFEPWVDPVEAERAGTTPAEMAAKLSDRWRRGLADWGVGPDRVARFVDGVDVSVLTPGSSSGSPVDVLGALDAPPAEVREDPEAFHELAAGTAGALLGLIGQEGDPLQDPAHVVVAELLLGAWSEGRSIDLPALIGALVDPPFAKVGVFPVETFFPRKDRMALALKWNALVSSRGFQAWCEGIPLDVDALMAKTGGKTAVRVFSLAHLDDGQRMFFVTLLLHRMVAWSRRQRGTSALRAVLYFDEVFGFLPPQPADPPTKRPILTLMKQARAVGLGTVLVSQNPIDVDYTALSNAGLWMIGRLQTRHDRQRVLDGLQGAGGGADRDQIEAWIESLPPRTFVVRDVTEPAPRLLMSRQTISYLRGPLTRAEASRLAKGRPAAQRLRSEPPAQPSAESGLSSTMPPLPGGRPAAWIDPRVVFSARLAPHFEGRARSRRSDGKVVYEPALWATVDVTFDEKDLRIDRVEHRLFFPIGEHELPEAVDVAFEPGDVLREAPEPGLYAGLPAHSDEEKELVVAEKRVADQVWKGEVHRTFRHKVLKLEAHVGETREAFDQRVKAAVTARIDAAVAELRGKTETKAARIEEKRRKLAARQERLAADQRDRLMGEGLNAITSVLGVFFGRGSAVKAGVRAVEKRQRTARAGALADDVGEDIEVIEEELLELKQGLAQEIAEIQAAQIPLLGGTEEVEIRLKKSGVKVRSLQVLWIPVTRAV